MDRINQAAFAPPSYDNTRKLPCGPSVMFDPGERAFVAEWLGHLAAGRVGGNPPMSDARKAEILANERVLRGARWRG
ncbi:hypothetical protein [Erythrobacter oryzae]|uniref:hypothetical protein n=1 Tax=Erythrobacter oryzae TaxID=3019556 RepID=UPI00255752FE|nr:hypothetical protein [Erythrobacter sp. COR-2]